MKPRTFTGRQFRAACAVANIRYKEIVDATALADSTVRLFGATRNLDVVFGKQGKDRGPQRVLDYFESKGAILIDNGAYFKER